MGGDLHRTTTTILSALLVFIGVAMIVVGLGALILGWVQHRQELRALRAEFGPMRYSIASIVAAMIAGLGIIALLGVMSRL